LVVAEAVVLEDVVQQERNAMADQAVVVVAGHTTVSTRHSLPQASPSQLVRVATVAQASQVTPPTAVLAQQAETAFLEHW
jgi:hypothetical protein